ncbi:hypothetical protein BH10CYA1_BH10CYA1_16790 [soil metagenome]
MVVTAALGMIKRGDLDPRYLGHPASTIIYPLCFYYHFLNATYFHGVLADPSANIENLMFDNIFVLCYLPRYLNVLLIVGSIPVLYKIGKEVFGKNAALMGIWMFPISQLLMKWGQILRSDVSALFYSMVAIYFCIRSYKEPCYKFQTLTAIFIGLAVSSRWPSLAIFSVYVMTNSALLWKNRRSAKDRLKILALTGYGFAIAGITFALTSPYVFLTPETLMQNLLEEKMAHGLGCDGLPPLGNFMWYINHAIPLEFYLSQSALAAIGIAIGFWKRNYLSSVLAVYTLAILTGTSLHLFHTDKWLLPILPLLALFAGQTLAVIGTYLHEMLWTKMKDKTATVLCTVMAVLFIGYIEYDPFIAVCTSNSHKMLASTDHEFYEWTFANIPVGTKICFVGAWDGGHTERYKLMNVIQDPNWFDRVHGGKYVSPFDIYHQGYKYFAWTSYQCPFYLAAPQRYPRECKFFKELFANAEVVKEFSPRLLVVPNFLPILQQGPTFRLYKFVPNANRLSDASQHEQNQAPSKKEEALQFDQGNSVY